MSWPETGMDTLKSWWYSWLCCFFVLPHDIITLIHQMRVQQHSGRTLIFNVAGNQRLKGCLSFDLWIGIWRSRTVHFRLVLLTTTYLGPNNRSSSSWRIRRLKAKVKGISSKEYTVFTLLVCYSYSLLFSDIQHEPCGSVSVLRMAEVRS